MIVFPTLLSERICRSRLSAVSSALELIGFSRGSYSSYLVVINKFKYALYLKSEPVKRTSLKYWSEWAAIYESFM